MTLPDGIDRLRKVRIAIPPTLTCQSFTAGILFDFLPKNQKLTEEFIYNNTNPEADQLPIYSASYKPIGYLPRDAMIDGKPLIISTGEVIIIIRQGYAGQMYIPGDPEFFPSEHTIPVRVKSEFVGKLNPRWFVRHYEPEVLHYVTGKADSRNFSELAFRKVSGLLPPKPWQDECAKLYNKMDDALRKTQKTLECLHIE